MRLPAWLTGRPPLSAEDRARIQREREQERERQEAEARQAAAAHARARAEAEEAQLEAERMAVADAAFVERVRGVGCHFPGDSVERLPENRLSGRSRSSRLGRAVEWLFGEQLR